MNDLPVSLDDIREASQRIKGVAYRTPLYHCPALSRRVNSEVYLKLECYQPIRAFKIRGASNKILKMNPADRSRGFVAASSGNHGLAVAYVAKLVGTNATIVVPTSVVPEKVAAIEEYGGKVVKHGLFDDERYSKASEILKTTGGVLVHPFDDPDIIAGQGTIGLEILQDLADVDSIIVPMGGGGLISGIATAVKNLKSNVKIIGVEPERAARMSQSLKNGKITHLPNTTTIADGLAVREPGKLTFECVKKYVDEITLVEEEEIKRGILTAFRECHLVIEPSAAAAIAALTKQTAEALGEKTVVVISGGNISSAMLSEVFMKH